MKWGQQKGCSLDESVWSIGWKDMPCLAEVSLIGRPVNCLVVYLGRSEFGHGFAFTIFEEGSLVKHEWSDGGGLVHGAWGSDISHSG